MRYCDSVVIDDCLFFNNISDSEGGVIFAEYSNFSMSNCDLNRNYGKLFGGAISTYYSSADISNCSISANTTSNVDASYGGAIFFGNSEFIINNTLIANNYSNYDGSAICIDHSEGQINFSRLIENKADNGGCFVILGNDTIEINNSEITHNYNKIGSGCGLTIAGGVRIKMVNSTISHNYADHFSGGVMIFDSASKLDLYNSIIHENYVNTTTHADTYFMTTANQVRAFSSCVSAHSNSPSSIMRTNCIDVNPDFKDFSESSITGTLDFTKRSQTVIGTDTHFLSDLQVGDMIYLVADGKDSGLCVLEIVSNTELILVSIYLGNALAPGEANVVRNHFYLQRKSDGDTKDSPCIDAGDNIYVNSVSDLFGNKRIADGNSDSSVTVDMGARELQ